jgi:hypothetical protein
MFGELEHQPPAGMLFERIYDPRAEMIPSISHSRRNQRYTIAGKKNGFFKIEMPVEFPIQSCLRLASEGEKHDTDQGNEK